jgi:hypothetical protein
MFEGGPEAQRVSSVVETSGGQGGRRDDEEGRGGVWWQ